MRDHVYPVIGVLPVSVIDTTLVCKCSNRMADKTETGSRVRGRIEAILDWARVAGLRDGPNPAAWKGHLAHMLPRRSQVRAVEHYRALDYREVPAFMSRLRGESSMSARLLEFVILTAARLGEARGATWDEVDLATATWTLPAERMKMSRQHRVPLANPAVALLRDLLAIRRGDSIFAGRDFGRQPGRPPLECWCVSWLARTSRSTACVRRSRPGQPSRRTSPVSWLKWRSRMP